MTVDQLIKELEGLSQAGKGGWTALAATADNDTSTPVIDDGQFLEAVLIRGSIPGD